MTRGNLRVLYRRFPFLFSASFRRQRKEGFVRLSFRFKLFTSGTSCTNRQARTLDCTSVAGPRRNAVSEPGCIHSSRSPETGKKRISLGNRERTQTTDFILHTSGFPPKRDGCLYSRDTFALALSCSSSSFPSCRFPSWDPARK